MQSLLSISKCPVELPWRKVRNKHRRRAPRTVSAPARSPQVRQPAAAPLHRRESQVYRSQRRRRAARVRIRAIATAVGLATGVARERLTTASAAVVLHLPVAALVMAIWQRQVHQLDCLLLDSMEAPPARAIWAGLPCPTLATREVDGQLEQQHQCCLRMVCLVGLHHHDLCHQVICWHPIHFLEDHLLRVLCHLALHSLGHQASRMVFRCQLTTAGSTPEVEATLAVAGLAPLMGVPGLLALAP